MKIQNNKRKSKSEKEVIMANWCVGILKIRGKWSDIEKFINNELEKSKEYLPYNYDPDGFFIDFEGSMSFNFTRGFVSKINWYVDFSKQKQILAMKSHFAWDVDTSALEQMSQSYNIDFKIFAFEKGMEFNRNIEVVNGYAITTDVIKFEDYAWDCIDPTIGG